MSFAFRRAAAGGLAAVLLVSPVAAFLWRTGSPAFYLEGQFPAGQSAYVMMRPAGHLAFVLLWIQVVLGSRGGTVARLLGLRTLVPLHRALGLTTLLFLLLHPLLFAWGRTLRTGKPAFLQTFFPNPAENYWERMVFFGAVSLGVLLAGILAATAGRRLLRRAWRGVHAVNYAGFLLSSYHSLSIGSETRVEPVFFLYWALGLTGGALLAARLFGLLRHRFGVVPPSLPSPDPAAHAPGGGSSAR
ncbi:MAG TPA: ferric reductase-like transmembrane domain-containing protein [Planctomycetota bacterium]|nr:ferric reductase-like transmembrane domain-containing protein [Planctomycetota bacterium]